MSSFYVNSAWFTVRPHKELCWRSFKVPCHAVGTEQGRSRGIWSQCQPSPIPHIQRAMQALPVPLFSSKSLAVCCLSSDPSAPYFVYFPKVYNSLLSPLHLLRFSPQNKSTSTKLWLTSICKFLQFHYKYIIQIASGPLCFVKQMKTETKKRPSTYIWISVLHIYLLKTRC